MYYVCHHHSMCVSGNIAVLSLEVLEQSSDSNFLAIHYKFRIEAQARHNCGVTFAAENLRIKLKVLP